jgi:hypothetical protein
VYQRAIDIMENDGWYWFSYEIGVISYWISLKKVKNMLILMSILFRSSDHPDQMNEGIYKLIFFS